MTAFADSCIAKDCHGEPKIFRVGQRVRIRHESCPTVSGAVDTVRKCFYQNQTLDHDALAVLLDNHSWAYCSNLEIL